MNQPYTRLLLATTNAGKIKEMRALLNGLSFQILTLNELPITLNVAETGQSYEENAALKAQAFAAVSALPTLADDSGLEVDALNGKPGIHSARFHPAFHATDADRRAYLLQCLSSIPQPWKAKFICVLCLAMPSGKTYFVRGECNGMIISQERGQNGFGYDPIFFIPPLGKTMAELSLTEKNAISHRAHAVRLARQLWFEKELSTL